jgi:MFS family permease
MVQGLPFAIFSIVAVYPIAWAADRFDRRLVFALCVLTWSLGTAACGLARNVEQLFLAAVAIAAGEAGLVPVGISFVPDLFKGRKRLLANGVFYLFGFGGIAGGLMLGGAAMALAGQLHGHLPASPRAFEAWRLAFFLVALPTPVFLILIAFTRLGYRGKPPAVAARDEAPRHDFWPFVRRHQRAVLSIFAGIGFYTLGVGGYFFWLPVAATRMFATTPAQNGTLMGAATAIGLVAGVTSGTFLVRRLVLRLGPMASIRFFWMALLAGIPIFLAFPFAQAAWHLFVLYGALMLVFTAAGCALPAIMQDMAPPDLRGRVAAIGSIGNGVVSGLSPSLVGWLSPAFGADPRMLTVVMGLIAIPVWIVAALAFRMAERPFVTLVRDAAADDATPDNHQD